MSAKLQPVQLARPLMLSIYWVTVATVWMACPTGLTRAQQPVQSPARDGIIKEAGDSQAETRRLLELLESPRFAERRNASRELRQRGVSAHAVLQSIAQSGDSESATRAVDLLKEGMRSSDPVIAESAREALQRIASSDSSRAISAGQALREPSQLAPSPLFQRGQQLPLPRARPPAFAQQGRTNLRISIRTTKGIREIEVVQNDKKYRFRDAGAGLETERPDGKGGIKKKTYKDSDELRKEDSEAFQAYQKAGGGKAGIAGGAIRITPRGLFGNGFAPLPRQLPKAKPPTQQGQ